MVFSFAFSWVWTFFGLVLRSEKSVMGVSMMVLFPLTFLSNVFVEPSTMPGWLQAFVKVNPITHLVASVRAAMAGSMDGHEHDVVAALERRFRGRLRHADHVPLQPPLTARRGGGTRTRHPGVPAGQSRQDTGSGGR